MTATIGLTAEQQDIRRTGVGASEVPALCGLSPWSTALDVWLAKTGAVGPMDPSDAMEAGNRFEDAIGGWYHDRTGRAVVKGETLRHPDHPHHLATPDLLWADDPSGLTQIKLVLGSAEDWGEEEDGEAGVPEYVRAQEQWEMHVSGRSVADVCAFGAFRGKQKLRIYRVQRDDELIDFLSEIVDHFWAVNVQGRVQPPIDGSEKTANWLKSRFARSNGLMLPATAEATRLAQEYLEAKALRDDAQAGMDLRQNALMALIGEADGIQGLVTWKSDKTGRPSWKDIAAALNPPPELVAAHTAEPGRRFLIKLKKEA